ncbi:MAG: hypothetical protein HQK96_09725 [Nitrospirae bacterium]|nr:hypothetical protein [Nitrospirota bacterium]MBF0554815.1 hypothetical protein [Nitrospirota bacterium]
MALRQVPKESQQMTEFKKAITRFNLASDNLVDNAQNVLGHKLYPLKREEIVRNLIGLNYKISTIIRELMEAEAQGLYCLLDYGYEPQIAVTAAANTDIPGGSISYS